MTTINKLLAYYDFLQLDQTPYLTVADLPEDERECFICKEPYDATVKSWEVGRTINSPVRLPCKHHLGIQCLARRMLSPNFDGHCSFCRTIIIPNLQDSSARNDQFKDFLRMLGIFDGCVTLERKTKVLKLLQDMDTSEYPAAKQSCDRRLMAFEEILDRFAGSQLREINLVAPALREWHAERAELQGRVERHRRMVRGDRLPPLQVNVRAQVPETMLMRWGKRLFTFITSNFDADLVERMCLGLVIVVAELFCFSWMIKIISWTWTGRPLKPLMLEPPMMVVLNLVALINLSVFLLRQKDSPHCPDRLILAFMILMAIIQSTVRNCFSIWINGITIWQFCRLDLREGQAPEPATKVWILVLLALLAEIISNFCNLSAAGDLELLALFPGLGLMADAFHTGYHAIFRQ